MKQPRRFALVCAAGVALLGIFKLTAAAIATTFTMGFGIAFVIVSAQTLMQQETPHDMLGRVSSSFMSVFSLAQVLGLLLSGRLALWVGIRGVFLICAGALLMIAFIGWTREKTAGPARTAAVEGAG